MTCIIPPTKDLPLPPPRVTNPRLRIPISLYDDPAHPPPDPYLNTNPGPGQYDPKYDHVGGFPTAPRWTVPPVQHWRRVQHPLDPNQAHIGKLTWHGRGADPYRNGHCNLGTGLVYRSSAPWPYTKLPHHTNLGFSQDISQPEDTQPMMQRPAFFRKAVEPKYAPDVEAVGQSHGHNGAKLTRYRKTMEAVAERRSARRRPTPTLQAQSADETFAKYHPALLLPDPAGAQPPRDLASSRPTSQQSARPSSSRQSKRSTGSTAHAPFLQVPVPM